MRKVSPFSFAPRGGEMTEVLMDQFFAYDQLLYDLYSSNDFSDMQEKLFSGLKNLISYDYASVLLLASREDDSKSVYITEVLSDPETFAGTEKTVFEKYPEELEKRLALTGEAAVVRLSSVESEAERLHTPVYGEGYKAYNIYDMLQVSIRHEKKRLGVLTLYRTYEHGVFEDRDVYLLKALSKHLNLVFYEKNLPAGVPVSVSGVVSEITSRVHMTPKETEILTLIFLAKSNTEICDELKIREHTLQKHFQNIYRKLNISSKWELLRYAFRVSGADLPGYNPETGTGKR